MFVYTCLLASSWSDLPVNLDRHLAFAPLIRACVRGVNLHTSLSNVTRDMTAALYYIDNFSSRLMSVLSKTCLNAPHVLAASAIRLDTSYLCWPSAAKIDPRYLKYSI